MYHENIAPGLNGFWVEAKDLRIGDVFLGSDGKLSTLLGTTRVEQFGGIDVFNFTVEGNHNYFVLEKDFQYGQACVLVHNALDYTKTPVFRGGESLNPRVGIDITVKNGIVKPGKGVSVNLSDDGLEKFGGAFRVTSIPKELEIIQQGKNLLHYEIVAKEAMSLERYIELLGQVVLKPW
ncbi:MAG: polymorphic toxin-type HINT domain-containing protein [Thermoguttaceae bacterium]